MGEDIRYISIANASNGNSNWLDLEDYWRVVELQYRGAALFWQGFEPNHHAGVAAGNGAGDEEVIFRHFVNRHHEFHCGVGFICLEFSKVQIV